MSFTKIGLYGDSFVEVWKEKNKLNTWPHIVADKFDLEIVHSGQGGTSYWDIPLNQFTLKPNEEGIFNVPDILIFCWTSSARIYNKDGIHLNPDPKKVWWKKGKVKDEYVDASEKYFKYIQDDKKEIAEYQSCLFWFDQTVLSKIPIDRKIIHLWSYGHNVTDYHPDNIKYLHTWENGLEIRPSCMSIATMDGCSLEDIESHENHFNTQEKHNLMADFVMHSLIDTNVDGGYDRSALNDYSENVIKNYK